MKLDEMFGQVSAYSGDPRHDAQVDEKLDQIPGQMTVDEVIQETEKAEEQFVTESQSDDLTQQSVCETTPSGLEIYYSWAPRRHYKLRRPLAYFPDVGETEAFSEWAEVPSVTSVLGVLDKSGPLTWWGMKVGVEGVRTLCRRSLWGRYLNEWDYSNWWAASTDEIISALTEQQLTVNHQMDKAADRGVNVHGALETYVDTGLLPDWTQWPDHEKQYVKGVTEFLIALEEGGLDGDSIKAEVMVGSLEHQYAGRYDLRLTLEKPVEVVTKAYPKRTDKVEEIPAGRYLLDLKTRKKAAVYNTNYLQLEAYEKASVECGYEPTDYRGVIVVTEGGQYQLSINQDWTFEDFAQVRGTYQVLHEREILRELREELGAKDAA